MKPYIKPQVVLHGSVENLTQAGKTGTILDACFCAGTPVTEITLS
ncbi:MAG: lasso RiPP family leader peptide-containing protein [Mangrovicoccus sp.]|nr:lasso RiPP family leader peptide-containing protein [Mangrovicoccus sp.]